MPELRCGLQRWDVAAGENLLDALNTRGGAVPFSCRAGHCQACLVRCLDGEPNDALPAALTTEQRQEGWRLACQCQIQGDLTVERYDPSLHGVGACIDTLDWQADTVLRLGVRADRPLRFQPGQHLVIWAHEQLARPYSLASLPGDAPYLEFHIDCSQPGAFAGAARQWRIGERLQLGALSGGALHYLPDWSAVPLWLIAGGTGLAPLWSVLRQALASQHEGPVRLVHVAAPGRHYLGDTLHSLAREHAMLDVTLTGREGLAGALADLRRMARRSQVLVCGSDDFVEDCRRRLFLAGIPSGQVHVEAFVGPART